MPSKHFAILANPASHSLSPAMHNAAFQFLQLPHRYSRCEIPPEYLADFFQNDAPNYSGFSVSVPHKETCMPFLNQIDESAKYIGAVNTIVVENDILIGYNTDYIGFIESLTEHYNPCQKTALVLGAGGAARAVVYGLLQIGIEKIYIWNRTFQKAKDLADEFDSIAIEDFFEVQNQIDLVINTTMLGMKGKTELQSPVPSDFWKSSHTAYDIVYTPAKTIFLCDAANAGAVAISGERMLSFQAQKQCELFTQKQIPVEILEFGMSLAKRTFTHWTPYHFTNLEKKDVLGTIVDHKTSEIFVSFEYEVNAKKSKTPNRFLKALLQKKENPHIIAEIKPASPSKGKLIHDDETIETIAKEYENGGASAISVLTDYTFFGGIPENIARVRKACSLPIVRKDFILHESQIAEAAFLGADAILLMRSVLPSKRIQELLDYAEKLGLDALVETHTEEELFSILDETTARIVGINARDLHTLEINQYQFEEMQKKAQNHHRFSEIIWVAESGISSKNDIEEYAQNADGVLIGSCLMKSENKTKTLSELLA